MSGLNPDIAAGFAQMASDIQAINVAMGSRTALVGPHKSNLVSAINEALQAANKLPKRADIDDRRGDEMKPSYYFANAGRSVMWEFRSAAELGLPDNNFVAVQTIARWTDQASGRLIQIAHYGLAKESKRYSVDDNTWSAWIHQ